jgi:lipopolysaccharide export LptBFGC system permease protein LptF
VNDKQKVAFVSLAVAITLGGIYWLFGQVFAALLKDEALMTAILIIIPVSVLSPIVRGIRK